jgi:hypothetical protein
MSSEEKEHPDFARGEDHPEEFPGDEMMGSFAEGQEESPDDEEREEMGRFSEGEEQLPEDDPEKHEMPGFGEVDEE